MVGICPEGASTLQLRIYPTAYVAALLSLAASSAHAQAVVRGLVQSDSSGRPITEATIAISALGLSARSQGTRGYTLDRIPSGQHRLRVIAVGYRPVAILVALRDNDTVTVNFRLEPEAVALPTIEVKGKAEPFVSGKLEMFERRRRLGFGTFLTRAMLREREHMLFSDLLRQLSGVQLVYRGRCGGYAMATSRGGGALGGGVSISCGPPERCYLALFVDGARVWAWDTGVPPNVDDYATRAFEAVEIYRGAGQLPIELQGLGTACGAVVLWTRTGESP